jgi:hypothetical protein
LQDLVTVEAWGFSPTKKAHRNPALAAGLKIMQHNRKDEDDEMARLCAAIDEGLESGVAEGDVIDQVLQSVGLPANHGPRCEQEEDAKMAALEAALEKGLRSGVAPPGVFARVRARAGLPPCKDDGEA